MSEMYSSSSGSYFNYLTLRQKDSIRKFSNAVGHDSVYATALSTGILYNKMHSTEKAVSGISSDINRNTSELVRTRDSIEQMQTGIEASINRNTFAIAASSNMLRETFMDGFNSVKNSIDFGFAGVSHELGTMTSTMTAGFDTLTDSIEQMGNSIIDRLDEIRELLRNPLQTASRELYNRSISRIKMKYYKDALDDIEASIEKDITNYLAWELKGKLCLFGVSDFDNVVDVSKALDAFTNACRYIDPYIERSDEAKKLAAEYYFYLGYSNYILSNESRISGDSAKVDSYLEASVKADEKSYSLSSNMLESLYNAAKCYSLQENREKAIPLLEKVIRIDGLYSVKVLSDNDFKGMEDDVITLIKKLSNELYEEIKKLRIDELHFTGQFVEVEEKLKKALTLNSNSPYLDLLWTLLNCKEAKEELLRLENQWNEEERKREAEEKKREEEIQNKVQNLEGEMEELISYMDSYIKKHESSDYPYIDHLKKKMDKLYEEAKEFSSKISCFNVFEEKRAAAAKILTQLDEKWADKMRKGSLFKKIFLRLVGFLLLGCLLGLIVFFVLNQNYVISVLCGIAALLFIIRLFVDNFWLSSIAILVLGVALFLPAFWVGRDLMGFFGGILFVLLEVVAAILGACFSSGKADE